MALDTRNKRLAVICWHTFGMPTPDGTLNEYDRAMLLGMPVLDYGPSPPPGMDAIKSGHEMGLALSNSMNF